MLEKISFRTLPFDNVGATMDKYLERLEAEAKALKLAVRVTVNKGDAEAERCARAELSALRRRIQELKRKDVENG